MFTSLMSFVVMTEKWVVGCIRDYAEDYLLHINHFAYQMCKSAETVYHNMVSYIKCIVE